MPASPRGCYSQCSSEQHKSSDSGLSSPRPGHSVVFLPLCDGTHRPQLFVPQQQQRAHDARCNHYLAADQTGAEAFRCAQPGMVRSSRPSSVEPTRSARYSWPSTTLLFGPVVHLAPRRPTAPTASPMSARRCGSAWFQLLCEQRSTRHCRRRRPATRSASAAGPWV